MSKSEGCYFNLLISFNERRLCVMRNENEKIIRHGFNETITDEMFRELKLSHRKGNVPDAQLEEQLYKSFVLPKLMIK